MNSMSIKKNINLEFIILCIGVSISIIHNLIFQFPENYQMLILLSLVFIVGVPHGALDFLVDEQNKEVSNGKFSIQKFVKIYLSRLFLFSLFWILPWLAFSLFIIFSIFHFGETDMAAIMKPGKSSTILYIAYGAFILSVLLLTHLSEIEIAVPILGTYLKGSKFYYYLQQYNFVLILLFAFTFLLTLFWQHKKNNIIPINLYKFLEFIFLLTIIVTLPMLLAFTFYFALWHSILSVRNIFAYFRNFNNTKNFTFICNKSILFSLLALGSIIVLYFAMHYFMPDMNLLFALLIVLSVLTLPHLAVMHSMYKNFSRNNIETL